LKICHLATLKKARLFSDEVDLIRPPHAILHAEDPVGLGDEIVQVEVLATSRRSTWGRFDETVPAEIYGLN
jgi:hypothetical protein